MIELLSMLIAIAMLLLCDEPECKEIPGRPSCRTHFLVPTARRRALPMVSTIQQHEDE